MDEWSEWKEVSDWSLVSDVSDEFAYDWDIHEVEYRMADGTVKKGMVWAGEDLFTYTDSDGEEVEDYDKRWYIGDDKGNPFDSSNVTAWRYKK